MEEIRLNKFLKDSGICSRRKADEFIEKGYIKVNGEVVKELGMKINPESDKVEIDSMLEKEKSEFKYILLYKPVGYVTTKNNNEGKTVFELLPNIENLTYSGRLDKESEGLLILSNDGEFIFSIAYPEFEKEKEYSVVVDKKVESWYVKELKRGVLIDGKITKPAEVTITGDRSYNIILREGMNRQIRKMAEKFGYKVVSLKRFRIKHIEIGDLVPGQWRYLTKEEIRKFKEE